MLKITIPEKEFYDEKTGEFVHVKEQTLSLEHSLVSISKWEAKWCKPFLGDTPKTYEESLDYIKCMTITQNVDPLVYQCLTSDNLKEINEYINAPMTATWFSERSNRAHKREIMTSEVFYYQMASYGIPFEVQKWHLNRLLTLLRVCGEKNQPPKKMSKKAIRNQNAALNAARRKRSGSRG